MVEFLIPMALSVLFQVIKNPDHVRQLRRALIKLRDALVALALDGV